MDYSKLSDKTLEALSSGKTPDYSTLTDEELHELSGAAPERTPQAESTIKTEPTTGEDAFRGLQEGTTLGGADELAGATQAGLDVAMSAAHKLFPSLVGKSPTQTAAALKSLGLKGDFGPTNAKEMYRQVQKQEEKRTEEARDRSPWAFGASEIAGSVLPMMLAPELMGTEGVLVKTAGKAAPLTTRLAAHALNAAPVGAVMGTLGSKHTLSSPQEALEVAKDAGKDAITASLLGAGIELGASGIKKIFGSKPAQEIAESYKMGKEGINPRSAEQRTGTLEKPETLESPLSLFETNTSRQIVDEISQADDLLGKNVQKTIQDATQKGVNIKPSLENTNLINDILKYTPNIAEGPAVGGELGQVAAEAEGAVPESVYENLDFRQFFDRMEKFKREGLSPADLQNLRQDLGSYAKRIYTKDPVASGQAYNLYNKLGSTLKNSVPGYGEAASRLFQFRQSIPETILSKENPVDITDVRVSGMRNVDAKLLNNIKMMIRGLHDPADIKAQGTFSNLLKGLQKLNETELAKKQEGKIAKTIFEELGISPVDVEKQIKTSAFKAKLLRDQSEPIDLLKAAASPAKTVMKEADKIANVAGNTAKAISESAPGKATNKVLQTGKRIYSATDDQLKILSKNISQIPGQETISKSLNKALENKDEMAKNAILFSIMQNPALRSVVNSDYFNSESNPNE